MSKGYGKSYPRVTMGCCIAGVLIPLGWSSVEVMVWRKRAPFGGKTLSLRIVNINLATNCSYMIIGTVKWAIAYS